MVSLLRLSFWLLLIAVRCWFFLHLHYSSMCHQVAAFDVRKVLCALLRERTQQLAYWLMCFFVMLDKCILNIAGGQQ